MGVATFTQDSSEHQELAKGKAPHWQVLSALAYLTPPLILINSGAFGRRGVFSSRDSGKSTCGMLGAVVKFLGNSSV